jgi:transcription elongation GreA/GreB family factor
MQKYYMCTKTKKYLESKLVDYREKLEVTLQEMGSAAAHNADLRENFAFNEKQLEVEMIKGQIIDLKKVLANAEVYKVEKTYKTIDFGCKFMVTFKDTGETYKFILGGEEDAKAFPTEFLNYKSPIGEFVRGKRYNKEPLLF